MLSSCRKSCVVARVNLNRVLSGKSCTNTLPQRVKTIVPSKSGVYEEYTQLVNDNKLQYDEHQYKIIKTLERVQQGIHQAAELPPAEGTEVMVPRGLYIYGEVGTGKYDGVNCPATALFIV